MFIIRQALWPLLLMVGLTLPSWANDIHKEALEQAVKNGLDWLAAQQNPDGSWGGIASPRRSLPAPPGGGRSPFFPMNRRPFAPPPLQPPSSELSKANQIREWSKVTQITETTGQVLLAFAANGELPDEGEYGHSTAKAHRFLLNLISPEGWIGQGPVGIKSKYTNTTSEVENNYSVNLHSLIALVLCELNGSGRTLPEDHVKIERMLDVLKGMQDQDGAWPSTYSKWGKDWEQRNTNANGTFTQHTLASTMLPVLALRAAADSGFSVPNEIFEKAAGYVRKCYLPDYRTFYRAMPSDGDEFFISSSLAPNGSYWKHQGFENDIKLSFIAVQILKICNQEHDPLYKGTINRMTATIAEEKRSGAVLSKLSPSACYGTRRIILNWRDSIDVGAALEFDDVTNVFGKRPLENEISKLKSLQSFEGEIPGDILISVAKDIKALSMKYLYLPLDQTL